MTLNGSDRPGEALALDADACPAGPSARSRDPVAGSLTGAAGGFWRWSAGAPGWACANFWAGLGLSPTGPEASAGWTARLDRPSAEAFDAEARRCLARSDGRVAFEGRALRADGRWAPLSLSGVAAPTADGARELGGALRWGSGGAEAPEPASAKTSVPEARLAAELALLRAERVVQARRDERDPLTGLLNRAAFEDRLQRLAPQIAQGDLSVALLHVDLDRFREINDAIGHGAGDHVLRCAAETLRAAAGPNDLVARVGGDEFVVLRVSNGAAAVAQEVSAGASGGVSAGVSEGVSGTGAATGAEVGAGFDASRLAERLIEALASPTVFRGRACRCGASIGLAEARGAGFDPSRLRIDAEIALTRAKAGGRGRVAAFHPALHSAFVARRCLADEIVDGVERKAFIPFYQPQCRASDGALSGIEALVRWRHPTRGVLGPAAFLSVAEEIGALPAIDAMVLEHALRDVDRLAQRGIMTPKISVNVTAERLRDPALLRVVRERPPGGPRLAFELLESIFLDGDDPELLDAVERVKASGVEIEIDDFGSGRASILGLLRVGPTRLKIDRQIVAPLDRNPAQRALISGILEIARAAEVAVTAEGVETREQARTLAEMGCDTLQGFYFSKPAPFDALESLLSADRWRAAG